MHTLIAKPGWGSAIIEAEFALAGVPLKIEDSNPRTNAADRERLQKLNPLVQIPTMILPDGQVMTESGALTLHLADYAPQSGLVPAAGDPLRPAFLRWLLFIVAEVYGTATISDRPELFSAEASVQREMQSRSGEYRESLWRMVEAAAGPGTWFLGERFSALDLYIAVMTRWSPHRDWFKANCPRLHAIALAVDAMPELAAVWQRNFPTGL